MMRAGVNSSSTPRGDWKRGEEVEVQVTANAKMPEYSTNTLNVKISVQYFNLLIIQQQIYLNLPACFLYLHMHICSHFVT